MNASNKRKFFIFQNIMIQDEAYIAFGNRSTAMLLG